MQEAWGRFCRFPFRSSTLLRKRQNRPHASLAAGPGNETYDYMASGGVPVVRAVGSGDKFIGIGAYGTAFAQEGDTAGAIAAAPAQSWETTSAYLVFGGFDAGEPVLTPLFP